MKYETDKERVAWLFDALIRLNLGFTDLGVGYGTENWVEEAYHIVQAIVGEEADNGKV